MPAGALWPHSEQFLSSEFAELSSENSQCVFLQMSKDVCVLQAGIASSVAWSSSYAVNPFKPPKMFLISV